MGESSDFLRWGPDALSTAYGEVGVLELTKLDYFAARILTKKYILTGTCILTGMCVLAGMCILSSAPS